MKHLIAAAVIFGLCLSVPIGAHQQTSDGGYIIAGSTESYTHGTFDSDILVYKLNASGVKQWRKNFGGTDVDRGVMIIQTADGGYIVVGSSTSYSNGKYDFLAYKIDASGAKQWRKNYGGSAGDYCYAVQQTADGGYILAGDSASYASGYKDFLLYKVDAAGTKLWRKNFGGEYGDWGMSVQQTSDGGYVVAGATNSYGPNPEFWCDVLIYKLDASGTKEWRKNFGGTYCDHAFSIQQTGDGGYIVAGDNENYTHGGDDFLVYKLNASGQKLWRKNFGGGSREFWGFIRQTSDGGYVLAGYTESYVNGTPGDDRDLIVYKLDASGTKEWRKNYGGEEEDGDFTYVWPTSDGGYFLFGHGRSYHSGADDSDFLCYKLDASGNKQWRKNFGGTGNEFIEHWD